MTKKRAAIYARISDDRRGAGLGVERQQDDCATVARAKGLEVTKVYVDNDISAYSGKRRPAYIEMLDDIRAGRIDAVVAWHEDRLHRSPRELEDYIDACERGVPTYFAQSGDLDLATSSGRMTARIRGAVSRQESEHKAERITRAHQQSAERGRWRGGARPFGWQPQDGGAVLVEAEANVVREACEALLSGASLGSLVADLNRRGITSSKGNEWNYSTLRQLLRRPKNAGFSEHQGEIVGTMDGWPAIVSEDVWRGVCAVLDDPTRRRSTSNRVKHLLAGIAVCGKGDCGAPLRSATVGSGEAKRTVYRCVGNGGGHVARDAAMLNLHVEAQVVDILSRGDWREALDRAQAPQEVGNESLATEAKALRARLTEAADSFADGTITKAQLERITARATTMLGEVEGKMSQVRRGTVLDKFRQGRPPSEVWEALTIDRKRDVLRELVDIVVLPTGRGGSTYKPEAVRFEWKVGA